jgi:hypothetical protein
MHCQIEGRITALCFARIRRAHETLKRGEEFRVVPSLSLGTEEDDML